MALKGPVVGIDLGGTNMQIGVVTPEHKITGRAKKKTRADKGADAVLDRLAEGVDEACDQAGIALNQVAAIGIGAPGAIDHERGIVMEAPNLRWNDYPLAKTLSARLGGKPVVLDNDVNVAVFGENRLGVGGNASDVLGVWVGTGIGGGLILNGELYHGFFGTAGEIGHTHLFPWAPLGMTKLEECCSRKYLMDRLARLIRANHESILPELTDKPLEEAGASTLAEAYSKEDALTVRVVNEAAELLGIVIANFVTVLSLPLVILGGGLTEAMGDHFVDLVQDSVRRHVFPDRCRKVKIVETKLADNAGLLGAALLARERLS